LGRGFIVRSRRIRLFFVSGGSTLCWLDASKKPMRRGPSWNRRELFPLICRVRNRYSCLLLFSWTDPVVELVAELLLVILRLLPGLSGSEDRRLRTMVVRTDGRVVTGPALHRWRAWFSEGEIWVSASVNLLRTGRLERRALTGRRMARLNQYSPTSGDTPPPSPAFSRRGG
jgi:hypothetical protein